MSPWAPEFLAKMGWSGKETFLGPLATAGETFLKHLQHWNPKINLVSEETLPKAWDVHWLDSLKGAGLLEGDSVVDLGSGGGFPLIPLALWAKHTEKGLSFVGVERVSRKRGFLQFVLAELGLSDSVAMVSETSKVPSPQRGKNKITLTSRAVAQDVVASEMKTLGLHFSEITWVYWGKGTGEGWTYAKPLDLSVRRFQNVPRGTLA